MAKFKLLGVGSNAKTIKGDGEEYETAILYMTPFKVAVGGKTFNSCSMAEQAGCIDACLNTAGRAGIIKKGETTNTIQAARLRKAQWFYSDREGFMLQLMQDIAKHQTSCEKRGIQAVVRLNGTTDIRWELVKVQGYTIFELFPRVQFYDYTKIANRNTSHIENYHLTWSYSGASEKYAAMMQTAVDKGMNVATVFRKAYNEKSWMGLPVVDGDKDDLRIKDPKGGHIVALYAKGKAKKDTSGFVVDA